MGEYDDDHHLLIFMNMDPSWVTSSGMMDPMDVSTNEDVHLL